MRTSGPHALYSLVGILKPNPLKSINELDLGKTRSVNRQPMKMYRGKDLFLVYYYDLENSFYIFKMTGVRY